jgi:hypothetical protein
MTAFPDWQKYVVPQRNIMTGCIPTGYEVLLRAAGVEGVDYSTFQEDFDLDLGLGRGQTEPRNNFRSVMEAIGRRYPHIRFEEQSFESGASKIAFIDEMISKKRPVLVSITSVAQGIPRGWHIMPIVDATSDSYLLLVIVEPDGTPRTQWMPKKQVEHIHDNYEGGKEIAYLAEAETVQGN